MRSPRDNRTERGILMSKTAYFMTDEQAKMLAELLADKLVLVLLKADSKFYETMKPVHETLIRSWTWNTDKEVAK